jgi:hypothetical protein
MRWLWQVGRVGLRYPFPPAFGSAIAWLLLSAVLTRNRTRFVFCGLVLGLAQYSYTSLRVAPAAVAVCIAVAAAVDMWRRVPASRVRQLGINAGLLFLVAALVCVPLGRYAFDEPQAFAARGMSRLSLDGPVSLATLTGTLLLNARNALLMFNWTTDRVWVNTIPNVPIVDPISGALFVLGCAYACFRILRFREPAYLYVLVLLVGGLAPSFLAVAFPHENPSTVRTGAAIPVVALLIATPPYLIARSLRSLGGERAGSMMSGTFLAATFGAIFLINFDQYHRVYPAQHERSSQHTYEIAQVVNAFLAQGGRRVDVAILPGAHWMDRRLVAIQSGDVAWDPLTPLDAIPQRDGSGAKRLVIVKPDDQASLETLNRWYPTAVQQVHVLDTAGGEPWFVTVTIPATSKARR